MPEYRDYRAGRAKHLSDRHFRSNPRPPEHRGLLARGERVASPGSRKALLGAGTKRSEVVGIDQTGRLRLRAFEQEAAQLQPVLVEIARGTA